MDHAAEALDEKKLAEAEFNCRTALSARPNDLGQLLHLSVIVARRGRPAEAEKITVDALAARPGQPDLLNRRGELLAQFGRKQEALACFDQAIEGRLNHPAAHNNLAAVLAELGDPKPRYSVSVITPTIGSSYLAQAIASVQAQEYPLLEHVIVVDGADRQELVRAILPSSFRRPIRVLVLPYNVGGGGFNGHRVYGALPFLVNSRFVAFLDEDNWFEPDHVAALMAKITAEGLAWAYSLRKIVDREGRFIINDDCESLGQWPTWNDSNVYLIDVNCYMLRRDLAITMSPLWYRRFRDEESPDFPLCRLLLQNHPRFATSGRYTVNYRVGMSPDSVQANFFLHGNAVMQQRYMGPPPWRAPHSS
jgi:hypothetical protein